MALGLVSLLLGPSLSLVGTAPGTAGPGTLTASPFDAPANASLSFASDAAATSPPRKLVIMSMGRSGSSELGIMLGHLARSDPDKFRTEVFGWNETAMAALAASGDPRTTLQAYFERQAEAQPLAEYVSMKWKPNLIDTPPYVSALRWAKEAGARVLWNVRNPLDIIISDIRHQQHAGLSAHCGANLSASGTADCVAQHHSPVELRADNLPAKLLNRTRDEARVQATLTACGVPHLKVRYEDVFSSDEATMTASRNAILGFLELPSASAGELRAAESDGELQLVNTAAPSNCDALSNADEVIAALRGTPYLQLLHCPGVDVS
jgi:hypothetical protein